MYRSESDVLDFVNENDVKFIRLAFCDVYGNQKNVSITPPELPRAFNTGISFDASSIDGFGMEERSDLLLFPDPSTLAVLPWRPSHGRVIRFFCNIAHPDGRPFELDGRQLLRNTVSKIRHEGFNCFISAECEFYLFKTDEYGRPTKEPLDNGGYLDITPADKGENVRREICLSLEEMGIRLESSRHEEGPGQNEIDMKYTEALESADNVTTYKSVVRAIAELSGLHASFSPKPLPDEAGNGMHINISVRRTHEAAMTPELQSSFMAGILEHIAEITAFLNPVPESYERLGVFKAPKYVSWAPENRSHIIRVPAAAGEYARLELRSPDCMANPYIAFALIMEAGIDGVKRGLTPPAALNINMFKAPADVLSKLKKLPESFEEAMALAEGSAFVRALVPAPIIEAYKNR